MNIIKNTRPTPSTPEQICTRLAAGKNPLTLSIEEWGIKLTLAMVGEYHQIALNGALCPLCIATQRQCESCDRCPLAMGGFKCSRANSPWRAVTRALANAEKTRLIEDQKILIATIHNMIDVLHAISPTFKPLL